MRRLEVGDRGYCRGHSTRFVVTSHMFKYGGPMIGYKVRFESGEPAEDYIFLEDAIPCEIAESPLFDAMREEDD